MVPKLVKLPAFSNSIHLDVKRIRDGLQEASDRREEQLEGE